LAFIGLRYVVAWLSVRFGLVLRVEFLETAMIDERVCRNEVLSAIRSEGVSGVKDRMRSFSKMTAASALFDLQRTEARRRWIQCGYAR
jgi:hypothetical protein